MKKRILAAFLCAGALAFAPVGRFMEFIPVGVFQQVSAAEYTAILTADNISEYSTLSNGTYLVSGIFSVEARLEIRGSVTLVLDNQCQLTAASGIHVPAGASLTISALSEDEQTMGSLTATTSSGSCAAIGGNKKETAGSIYINGGRVTASGSSFAAGIGGGNKSSFEHIEISGGIVNATGSMGGAGIGNGNGGNQGKSGTILISGGKIAKAQGGRDGAGIGGGAGIGDSPAITSTGGDISAQGGTGGAGIGAGGSGGDCSSVSISGGKVTAFGNEYSSTKGVYSAGIGGGYSTSGAGGSVDSISITGGLIYADYIGPGAGRKAGPNSNPIVGEIGSIEMDNTIVFLDNQGTVYGTVAVFSDFNSVDSPLTIPAGAALVVPEDMVLTINSELTVNGTLIVNGTIVNNGTIIGNGRLEYGERGTLEGSGTIAETITVVEFQPEPEPTPDPEPSEPEPPSEPSEEEEETYIPSAPISDGLHEYSLGTMLYQGGKRVKGLYEYEGSTYYFNEQGFMQTGWVELEDGWRYFGEDGKMVTGWLQIGNVWYYLDPKTGLMFNDGLAVIGKSTYYFYDWGGMASDWWYEAEDGWYFFGGSGAMKAAQWVEWNGDWYYITESGRMAADTTVGTHYVNVEGAWVE